MNAQIYWPEGKVVEGFPLDAQPTLPPGTEGNCKLNPVTGRLELVSAFIDGVERRLVNDPRISLN